MAQKKKKGGFFSGLSSAVDGLASSIDKAAKDVSSDVANITINPLDHLHHGNVITIISKSCGKGIVVDSQGMVYCSGLPNQLNTNSAGQFEVVQSQYSAAAIKLRNLAYPQFYLAIVNGYFIGNGQGGPECDFYGRRGSDNSSVSLNEFCAFESAMTPGSHIGVLQTGQFTAPSQTNPHGTNFGLFRIKFIKHNKPPPPAQAPPKAQGSPQLAPGPAYGAGGPPPGAGYGPPPTQQQGYPGPPPQYSNPPPPTSQPPHEKQGYPPPTAPPPQM